MKYILFAGLACVAYKALKRSKGTGFGSATGQLRSEAYDRSMIRHDVDHALS